MRKSVFQGALRACQTLTRKELTMEAERINQIEAALEDLSARTEDLRRYL